MSAKPNDSHSATSAMSARQANADTHENISVDRTARGGNSSIPSTAIAAAASDDSTVSPYHYLHSNHHHHRQHHHHHLKTAQYSISASNTTFSLPLSNQNNNTHQNNINPQHPHHSHHHQHRHLPHLATEQSFSFASASQRTKRSESLASLLNMKSESSSQQQQQQSRNVKNAKLVGQHAGVASCRSSNAKKQTNQQQSHSHHHHHLHHLSHLPHQPHQQQQQHQQRQPFTVVDYCKILNMNTVYQILATCYDDTEDSMARLSLDTAQNASIQKRASLSEQMAALFGSSMCSCYFCKIKSIDTKRVLDHNFEILPNKSNSNFKIVTYTYSTPYSQISPLKLFNLMNTDCSVSISIPNAANATDSCNATSSNDSTTDNNNNNVKSSSTMSIQSSLSSSTTSSSSASYSSWQTSSVNNQQFISPSSASLRLQSVLDSNESLYSEAGVASLNASSVDSRQSFTTTTNNNNSSNSSIHLNSNNPQIYDVRYMYVIDCRRERAAFDRLRINTAVHYKDVLDDNVYLSSPAENSTIVVLYDEDGSMFASVLPPTVAVDKDRATVDEQALGVLNSLRKKMRFQHQCVYILAGGFRSFHAKFPFMCSQLDIRSMTDRHKYLVIYPNCVIENQIYIGSGNQAKNWRIVRDLRITHIINCSVEHECVFTDEVTYLHVQIEDSYSENILGVLGRALDFIQQAFDAYRRSTSSTSSSSSSSASSSYASSPSSSSVEDEAASSSSSRKPVILIHCNLGISRSSSVLIAYLIHKYRFCLYSAFKYVKDKRLQIAPNYSFFRQLKQFAKTC